MQLSSSTFLLLLLLLNTFGICHPFVNFPTSHWFTPTSRTHHNPIQTALSSTSYDSDVVVSINSENDNDRSMIPQREVKKVGTTRVVVVGGGVGGLAVASRLASSFSSSETENVQVILLEKNSRETVGGRCGSFEVNVPQFGTFRHERGPSLLLLKDVYQDLFDSNVASRTSE